MKRILVITELFLPTKGGTAVWAAEVYRRLGGKEIHIVTADVPGAREVDEQLPNSVHRLDLRRVPWLRPESLLMYWRFFRCAFSLAVTHRFEAVHAIRALPEGLVAWLVARLTRRPVVIYAHGEELTSWGRGGKYRAMRFALCHSDRVIANSGYTRDELLKMGVRAERILLIHPGVDVARFHPGLPTDDLRAGLGLQQDECLLLSVGRLSRRKGFDMVIRSLPALLRQGIKIRYVLIGIGEDERYLVDLAHQLGVAERVHLLGHVSPEDLPRWYNACELFVMPNREINGDTEGFGMVFVEAAACGKAVLAGQAGGTGSAVQHRQTGLRVDGSDQASVEQALIELLGNDGLRQGMGEQGLQFVLQSLAWEKVAEKTAAMDLSDS